MFDILKRPQRTGTWADGIAEGIHALLIFGVVSFVVAVIAIIALIVLVVT